MKSIYLSICLLLVGFNSRAQFQEGVFRVDLFPPSSTVNVVPNDNIVITGVIDPLAIPAHNCVANVFQFVDFNINYYLVDQVTLGSILIHTQSENIEGKNCASDPVPNQHWNSSFSDIVEGLTIPCFVPAGSYWLRVEFVQIESSIVNFNNNPPTIQGGSDVQISITDVNLNSNNTVTISDPLPYILGDIMEIIVISSNGFSLSYSSTNTACNVDNGTATVSVTGTNTPYTYLWSDGQTSQTATNLGVGSYDVIVTDVYGCSITEENIVINYPYNVAANLTTQQPCTYDEGAIYAVPSGGVAPYSYAWSSGQQTQNIEGVIQDTYTVTVTDVNGCVATETTTLTNQADLGNPTYYDYPNGLTITNAGQNLVDADYDGKIRFRGTLIIKSGVHYTINNKTLEFARDLYPHSPDQGQTHSGVIVEEGAKLTAANTTFKGVDACDAMWQGIQVWGADYTNITHNGPKAIQAQLPNLNHGKFYPTNCVIQDAFVGIALYRVNVPFTNAPVDHGRGYVKAKYTNFLNNRISVGFKARTSVVNTSEILQCNFICNQALIHPFKYNGEGSDIFISLLRVDKPQIKANTFTGHLAFTADKRATGIRSYASAYKVQSGNASLAANAPLVPNTFNDLSQGIDIYAKGGGVKTIRIKDNRFNNVYQGIIGNGSNFDEISFNTFNIPMGEPFFNAWGIYLETASGFLATENTFNTLATNNLTFGFVAKDVDLINGEIYKNDFNGDFESATQAEGLANGQLQIDCNQYLGTNTHDWTILSSIMADQGDCLPNDLEAQVTNTFSVCSGLPGDVSDIYDQSIGFVYNSDLTFSPSCISPTIGINDCATGIQLDFNNLCPQRVLNSAGPQYVNGLKNQFDNLPPGLQRNKVKGNLIRELAKNGDTQGIIDVLTTDLLPEDKKILIPIHIKKEKYNEARYELNTLNIITTEDQSFYDLFDVLITIGETNRVLDEITIIEKQTIEYVANTQTAVAVQAQSVLAELNEANYIRFPQQIPPTSSGMIVNGNENPTQNMFNDAGSELVELYPNPNDGNFTINFKESINGQGHIIDAIGRIVLTIDINDTQNNYQIHDLPFGIYTLIINYNDGRVEYTRVISK